MTRYLTGALLVTAVLLAAGCPEEDTDADQSGDGDSSDGGMGVDDGDGADVTALPTTAFVFVRTVREDVDHIVAFDTATGEETLITELDDDGNSGTDVDGLAVSPDRKWIAFTAIFRPTQEDADTNLPAQILWVVSVDGQIFRRLSATIQNPHTQTCSTDFDCQTTTGHCNSFRNRCEPRNFSMDVRDPAWSADGQNVLVNLGMVWFDDQLAGGVTIARVSIEGSHFLPLASDALCQVVSDAVVRPETGDILEQHSVCLGGANDGLFLRDIQTDTVDELIAAGGTIGDIDVLRPAWIDRDNLIFASYRNWDVDGNGTIDSSGVGLLHVNVATQQIVRQVPPLAGIRFSGVAAAPAGNALAMCLTRDQGGSDIFVLTDDEARPVTSDGKSCELSW